MTGPTTNETKEWLQHVAAQTGLSFQQIAERAAIAPTTITRFMADRCGQRTMTSRTLEKIGSAVQIAPYQYRSTPFGTFAESEAVAFDPLDAADDEMTAVVALMLDGRPNRSEWVLRTDAISSAGYLRGDTVIVDGGARPRDNDIVCAQVYDWQQNRTETIFRLYQKPWLVVHSGSVRPVKPLVVDDENVVIKGPVIHQLRARRSVSP